MTFKVGNKVRIIESPYGGDAPVGSVGVVTETDGFVYMVSNNNWMGKHYIDERGNFHLCFWGSELELVE